MKDDVASVELILRMRKGDVSALAALYDRHATVVYSLACRIVRVPTEAEDVVQATFQHVWQDAWRFDSARHSVQTWLLTLTRRYALDHLRRTRNRADGGERLGGVGSLPAAAPARATSGVGRVEPGREMHRRFEALPATQRVAVELAAHEGLTPAEIADLLCESLATVRRRIRLALDRLCDAVPDRPSATSVREPSPFTVALAEHLARRPLLTPLYRRLLGLRILVVDDDSETLDMIATVLRSAGASVATARSTANGLAHLDVAWPDVVLADLAMPRDDGYSFLRQARALAQTSGRRLTMAAFTALGDGERERALRAGFTALVSKPVSPNVLLDVIGRVASRAA